MKFFYTSMILMAIMLFMLTGCNAYKYNNGLIPISPAPYGTTESIRPILSWKTEETKESNFDIIIYSAIENRSGLFGDKVNYSRGIEVYYREDIKRTSHQVEQQLEPRSMYFWGVRTRNGTNVGPWSTYDFTSGIKHVTTYIEFHNNWWSFYTPKQ